jgi:hypothetical protein
MPLTASRSRPSVLNGKQGRYQARNFAKFLADAFEAGATLDGLPGETFE